MKRSFYFIYFFITLELENMFVRTKNIVTIIPPLPGTTFGGMKKLIDVMVVSAQHGM